MQSYVLKYKGTFMFVGLALISLCIGQALQADMEQEHVIRLALKLSPVIFEQIERFA